MRKIFLTLIVIHLSIICLGQITDYENQLAQYLSDFKNNAYSDEIRLGLIEKVQSLKDKIEIQINLQDYSSKEYQSLVNIRKKIGAFNEYLRCFSNYAASGLPYSEFNYINKVLEINPIEMHNIGCNFAKFFEIKIGDFKAIMVYNLLKPQDEFDYKSIKVTYNVDYNGRIINGGFTNVGGGLVKRIMYLSDQNKSFFRITSVTCSKIEQL
jgi:hypothetical protein